MVRGFILSIAVDREWAFHKSRRAIGNCQALHKINKVICQPAPSVSPWTSLSGGHNQLQQPNPSDTPPLDEVEARFAPLHNRAKPLLYPHSLRSATSRRVGHLDQCSRS